MKLKNKIFGVFVFVTMMILCFGYMKDQSNIIKDLAFENIEALAGGESGGSYICIGHGSVDCDGAYVEIKISDYRLGE